MSPYAIITLLIAWVASLGAMGYWQNSAGHVAERSVWQTSENKQLSAANAKIVQLEEGARNSERANALAMSTISTDYERKLTDARKQRSDDAAAVRSGTLRLLDPGAPGINPFGSIAAPTGSGSCRCDGRAPGELSPAASEFLLDLANDADDVARQLSACQRVVIEDRMDQQKQGAGPL